MTIAASRTEFGPHFSEGARLLWTILEERGWSQGRLAKEVGAKGGVVPRWLYGVTKPGLSWAVKLRDVLGIALEAWSQKPSEPFVLPAARVPATESATDLSAAARNKSGASIKAGNGTEG